MGRSSLVFRIASYVGVGIFGASQIATALTATQGQAGGAIPQIYLENCPDTKSGNGDDVGVTETFCIEIGDALPSDADMRTACKDKFHAELEGLYECKTCPVGETGCDSSISSDGFTANDCTRSPVIGFRTRDCNGDGDDEQEASMECSSTQYDWTYKCDDCG